MTYIDLVEYRVIKDKVRCPNVECNGNNYYSFDKIIDHEWISFKCRCINCKTFFQINYRAVSIDVLDEEGKPKIIDDSSYPLV